MNNRFIRQKDLVDSKIFKTPILIAGVGGIGSFTALTLAKMGFDKLICYDDDKVSEENLPNQFYREEDVVSGFGRKKVLALNEIIKNFTGVEIEGIVVKFPSNYNTLSNINFIKNGVVISAVDSISARKDIYEWYKKNKKKLSLKCFIDGRMGRHQAELYVVKTSNDEKNYEKRFWPKDQIDNLRCTEKAVIYNVLYISSLICNQLKIVLENKFYKSSIITDLENMDVISTRGGTNG